MSTPDLTPTTMQKAATGQLSHLTTQTEAFPGFALPEAVLHSIPLPTEFEERVLAATHENQVKSILPSFFNPLFRRQGVLNKHTIHALKSVGQSLAHLAREIEGRDRILEQLTCHLNAYGEHAHRNQLELANFTEHLAWQLREATSSLQVHFEQEASAVRLRTDTLLAIARTTERRLGELQNATTESSRQTEAIKLSVKEREIQLHTQSAQQAETNQRTESSLSEINRRIEELKSAAEEREILLRTQSAQLAETRQQTEASLSEISHRIEELKSAAEEREVLLRTQSAETNRQTTASLSEINRRIEEVKTEAVQSTMPLLEKTLRLTAVQQHAESQLIELRQQIDSIQRNAQAVADQQTEMLTMVAALRAGVGAAAEHARSEAQNAITAIAKQTELTEPRITAIEERLNQIEARLTDLAAKGIGAEALLTSVRASHQSQLKLKDEFDLSRTDLGALAEFTNKINHRLEYTEASHGGTKALLETILPVLQSQLESLSATVTEPQRHTVATGAIDTIKSAQLAESDALYVALEARFRGPRTLIRERQSKYIPIIEDTRKRVGLFPPPTQVMTTQYSSEHTLASDGVLDLGCGRGEWLELLNEHGVSAVGVDRNRFFLETCRQKKCSVIDTDIIEFLRSAPDESVAVVTSFHVIEHLPIPVFQEMTRHVLRILRRGGAAIFETPNPGNVLTSSMNFLLDPTHLRPVHPEFARLIMETHGFSAVQLQFMSPYNESYQVGPPNDPLAQRFNEYFYGPQDYAVIGIKP